MARFEPGLPKHLCRASGDWVFVDIGFAGDEGKSKGRTCGFAENTDECKEITFAKVKECVIEAASRKAQEPLNLLLEAPLSVAFNTNGNPTGRRCEVGVEETGTGSRCATRYWYSGVIFRDKWRGFFTGIWRSIVAPERFATLYRGVLLLRR